MDALKNQDAIMEGVGRYAAWKKEFLSRWTEAIMKGQLKQAFAMMPPEYKEWLKKNDPQGYKKALEVING